jgi:hypothetical protein
MRGKKGERQRKRKKKKEKERKRKNTARAMTGLHTCEA